MKKIGIFINKFTRIEQQKDPGNISDILSAGGFTVTVYCFLDDENLISKKYNIKKISKDNSIDPTFWKKEEVEYLIIYSWLSVRYQKLLKVLNASNVKLYLKLDSDGHLIYPSKPSYLRVFGLNKKITSKISHMLRLFQWYLFSKYFSKLRIKQIQLCDGLIIESPQAGENLKKSLVHWGRSDLAKKINIISNPVKLPESGIDLNKKQNYVISVGRWDDSRKNTKVLIRSLVGIGSEHGWEVILIGGKSNEIKTEINALNRDLKIYSFESLPNKEVYSYLVKSKIFFIPSISEGFNVSSCEAVVCGCSLTATPLECFEYLSGNGLSGVLSDDLKIKSFDNILLSEMQKWNNGEYDPITISKKWQEVLSFENVGNELLKILK